MAGTYGESQVSDLLTQLQDLKQKVASGKMTLSDYYGTAEPLVKRAADITGSISRGGSKQANAVNPIWSQIVDGGFVKAEGGKWVTQVPFSRLEYAKLPDNVLPTREDVQKGYFDPSLAPMERYQQAPSQPSTGNPGSPTSPGNPGAPQTNPALPPDLTSPKEGIDTRTDQGKLEQEGARQAKELADVLAQQKQIRTDASATASQKYDQLYGESKKNLGDLAGLLATNQMNLFNRSIPDLAEQANTAGILPSTGFGNLLANKYGQLTQDTQQALALQGLSDRGELSKAKAGLIGQDYSIAGQYAGGLGDVANTKLGFQSGGLQRQFSLDDYAKQVEALSKYGSAPSAPTASKGASALQGGLGGASTGAMVGGPWGAVIGGTVGAAAGGQASRK